MDDAFLDSLESHLKPLFKDTPSLHWANGKSLDLKPESVTNFELLRREMPPKQWCRVKCSMSRIHNDLRRRASRSWMGGRGIDG